VSFELGVGTFHRAPTSCFRLLSSLRLQQRGPRALPLSSLCVGVRESVGPAACVRVIMDLFVLVPYYVISIFIFHIRVFWADPFGGERNAIAADLTIESSSRREVKNRWKSRGGENGLAQRDHCRRPCDQNCDFLPVALFL
jgi:hypothetical protein